MNRPQENTIETLALKHGGQLLIREGYEDKAVRVTTPRGAHWIVGEDGTPVQQLIDGTAFSIDWEGAQA